MAGFWTDISAGKIWDDTLGVFFGSPDENTAAKNIAEDSRLAEAAVRQDAAPVGGGGTLTGAVTVPSWLIWTGVAVVGVIALRELLK